MSSWHMRIDRMKPSKGMARGFTLLELLVVVLLLSVLLAVTIPASYSMVQGYRASLEAEKVLLFFSRLKRESFQYSHLQEIKEKEGRLLINNGEVVSWPDILVRMDDPIMFYENGTSSGGVVEIEIHGYRFQIDIDTPSGKLVLQRGT